MFGLPDMQGDQFINWPWIAKSDGAGKSLGVAGYFVNSVRFHTCCHSISCMQLKYLFEYLLCNCIKLLIKCEWTGLKDVGWNWI